MGDYNASIEEYGSESSHERQRRLKERIEKNSLEQIALTSHSSKRSSGHTDLAFTNSEKNGNSNHWQITISCGNALFKENRMFSRVCWKTLEANLMRVQEFGIEEQNSGMRIDECYVNHVRLRSTPRTTSTHWKERKRSISTIATVMHHAGAEISRKNKISILFDEE